MLVLVAEAYRTFKHQRVNERLREISSELTLSNVEFLGEEAWRTAARTIALEPACGAHAISRLSPGQGHHKPTEKERALRLTERTVVGLKPIAIEVLGQLGLNGVKGRKGARVMGRYGTPNPGEQ